MRVNPDRLISRARVPAGGAPIALIRSPQILGYGVLRYVAAAVQQRTGVNNEVWAALALHKRPRCVRIMTDIVIPSRSG
jgi:hypothetical protein